MQIADAINNLLSVSAIHSAALVDYHKNGHEDEYLKIVIEDAKFKLRESESDLNDAIDERIEN